MATLVELILSALGLTESLLKPTADRRPTLTRHVAWGLTVTWAAYAFLYLAFGPGTKGLTPDEVVCSAGLFLLPVFVTVFILGRSEAVGGVVLILDGLLWIVLVWDPVAGHIPGHSYAARLVAGTSVLLPLVAGPLLLASWWRSRAADIEQRERVKREAYEAAKRYHQARESLKGVDLSRRDLTGIDLSSADLRGANLMSADLSRANLEGADLSTANLDDANLQGANLWRANLHKADLLKAVLEGATLDDSTVMPEGWEETVARKP